MKARPVTHAGIERPDRKNPPKSSCSPAVRSRCRSRKPCKKGGLRNQPRPDELVAYSAIKSRSRTDGIGILSEKRKLWRPCRRSPTAARRQQWRGSFQCHAVILSIKSAHGNTKIPRVIGSLKRGVTCGVPIVSACAKGRRAGNLAMQSLSRSNVTRTVLSLVAVCIFAARAFADPADSGASASPTIATRYMARGSDR